MSTHCVYESYKMQLAFATYEHLLAWAVSLMLVKAFNRVAGLFRGLRFARAAVTLAVRWSAVFAVFIVTMTLICTIFVTILFGQTIFQLRSWPMGLTLMMGVIVGDVDSELFEASRFWHWGAMYMVVITFVYSAILITVFVAVVEQAFEAAGGFVEKEVPDRALWTGYADLLPDRLRPFLTPLLPNFSLKEKEGRLERRIVVGVRAVLKMQASFRGHLERKRNSRFKLEVANNLEKVRRNTQQIRQSLALSGAAKLERDAIITKLDTMKQQQDLIAATLTEIARRFPASQLTEV